MPTPKLTMKVPLLDLVAQHQEIREEAMAAIVSLVDSQKFILGDEVAALESEIAAYCQTSYAIGCASGSDALLLALKALDIGKGDEVLTTPYTFFATAGSIVHAGATPVFADIDPETFNLDITRLPAILDRHPNVRAIMPVHLFGACADMEPLCRLAADRGIPVIEDAAQSIGSEYDGQRAGSIGRIGCFSFFPSKNLGGYGDGGIMTTNDAALAHKLKALRVHGSFEKYYHEWVGLNSRLDALQAAVLRVKLRRLDAWSASRAAHARLYQQFFEQWNVPVRMQLVAPYQTRHIYNQFVICTDRRDALKAHLQECGIGTEIYYPVPLHLQKCFAELNYRAGDFPVSEQLALESLSLPVYPELTPEQLEYVARAIAEFFA